MFVKIQIEKNKILQYIFLYFFLLIHGAWIYSLNTNIIRNTVILVSIAWIVLNYKKVEINLFYHVVLVVVLMYILSWIHGEKGLADKSVEVAEQILILLITFFCCKEKFVERYVRIVALFAGVSLLFYAIQLIYPNFLMKILPRTDGWGQGTPWATAFYGKVCYVYRGTLADAQYRNNGIFSEPGRYQIVLNTAIYFLLMFPKLFSENMATVYKYLVVLIITLLTTGSTNGYMGLGIVLLMFFISKQAKEQSKIRGRIVKVVFVFLVLLILNFIVAGNDSLIGMVVVNKISEMNVDELSSGMARMNVLNGAAEAIRKNPLIGVGLNGVYSIVNRNANVGGGKFAILAGAAGIPYVLLLVYPYVKRAFNRGRNVSQFVLYVLLFLNTALSQSRELYPALLAIPLVIQYASSISIQERE